MAQIPPETVQAWFENLACISSYAKKGRVKDRTFEVEFLDRGVRAYVFTFG